MELLSAVNLILPKLGERPVTSLEVRHPTLSVLLPTIDQRRRELLARGWWFNEYPYTAMPGLDGEINLGVDTLTFVPDRSGTAVMRGKKLFNPVTLSTQFTSPVKGRVTQDVPFDDLPEHAAHFVYYSGLVDMYTTDIGMSNDVQAWGQSAAQAWSDLLAEHLRQKKHSTRKSSRWGMYAYALRV